MAGMIIAGALSAFGFLCAMWLAVGWLLPGGKHGVIVCFCTPGLKQISTVHRWEWLRGMGLIRCPVILVDCGLSHEEKAILLYGVKDMELCSLEALAERLELERKEID